MKIYFKRPILSDTPVPYFFFFFYIYSQTYPTHYSKLSGFTVGGVTMETAATTEPSEATQAC